VYLKFGGNWNNRRCIVKIWITARYSRLSEISCVDSKNKTIIINKSMQPQHLSTHLEKMEVNKNDAQEGMDFSGTYRIPKDYGRRPFQYFQTMSGSCGGLCTRSPGVNQMKGDKSYSVGRGTCEARFRYTATWLDDHAKLHTSCLSRSSRPRKTSGTECCPWKLDSTTSRFVLIQQVD